MSGGPTGGAPDYKVYRARRGPLGRLRGEGGGRLPRFGRRPGEPRRPGASRITPGRVLKWILLAALGWILLSAVVFMVSAQLTEGVSESAEDQLSPGGSLLTGSTVLVLGSDRRPPGSGDLPPGQQDDPGRADSILLLRVGLGSVRRLSILRDTLAEIPGRGVGRINASYAFGGPGLTIQTVENFLGNGLEINHVIEVSFENFPDFIDSLGGIDVNVRRRICAPPFGEFERGFRLRRGEHHLNGRRALGFARVRKNPCAPNEDDRARAARQQEVLRGIRSQLISPSTFLRLPWVSWQAPRTVRSDMEGPGLVTLFTDLLTGGSGKTRVLVPTGAAGGGLVVSPEARRRAVRELLGR